jgi:TetR/AcrR family transcriptional regulator, transcriptional repressor for nem operon
MAESKREQTRQKIVNATGRGVMKHGYGGIGVDGIAKDAGVTSGAFYGHFSSKSEAFESSVSAGMEALIDGLTEWSSREEKNWLSKFIGWYLSDERLNDLDNGCALPGLSVDVSRADDSVKLVYETKLQRAIEILEPFMKSKTKAMRYSETIGLLAILAGGVVIVRAVNDRDIRTKIVKGIIRQSKMIAEVS